jgi:uncharacterized protein
MRCLKSILVCGALALSVTAFAEAPLVEAARVDTQSAMALLATSPKPDINKKSSDGTSALHWAVHRNDETLIKALLDAGADANAKNDYGSTPMSEAATIGNARVIQALLKHGADVDSPNADGQTALMIVAQTDNVDAAKLLLKHGAKINAREKWRDQTALMWAAAEARPAMVKLLISYKADVNARSKNNNWERQVTAEPRYQARPAGGFTPLLYAARKGCVECAQHLVKAGADIELNDPDGVTPLLMSLLNFNFDTAAFLISKGAQLDRWDYWGRSPLYAAVDGNTLPTGGRADRPSLDKTTGTQVIEMLLKAGANPNLQLKLFPPHRSLRDDRGADVVLTIGSTPLLRAAKAGDIAAMKLLLAYKANVELPTINGVTPLLAASGIGSSALDTRGRYKTEAQATEAILLLLANGADIKARDRGGQMVLHGAAKWGWNDLVKQLAALKVDLHAKDAQGRTAADIARGDAGGSSGRASSVPHPETEKLLLQLMSERSSSAELTRTGL